MPTTVEVGVDSRQVRRGMKKSITRVGAHLPEVTLHNINAVVNYLETGRWMRAHGYTPTNRVDRREEVFDAIAAEAANRAVLYLEFGVYEGRSMRYWSKLLRNPASHLHGFDSFQGLPATWTGMPPGFFSTNGRIPEIEDDRVRFFPGWFEDTLPRYEPPPHEQLVVAIDSDLYSSAALVLRSLEDLMVPGTYLYFDEFHDRANELKAFDEFLERTEMRFRLVGATHELTCVAFQRMS